MLRLLAVLIVAVTMVAVAFASAASIGVNGGTIQAGEDTTLTCDANRVLTTGWGLETDDGDVYFVRIGDIDPACVGNDLFVNITSNNVKVAEGSVEPLAAADVVGGSQGYAKVNFNVPVPAYDITDLHVFIEGPNGTTTETQPPF